jgi:hypothetical protein
LDDTADTLRDALVEVRDRAIQQGRAIERGDAEAARRHALLVMVAMQRVRMLAQAADL